MPAIYLGHGAPALMDDVLWPLELAAWSKEMPRPKAILVVSAPRWTDGDSAVLERLKRSGLPVVLALNKIDRVKPRAVKLRAVLRAGAPSPRPEGPSSRRSRRLRRPRPSARGA